MELFRAWCNCLLVVRVPSAPYSLVIELNSVIRISKCNSTRNNPSSTTRATHSWRTEADADGSTVIAILPTTASSKMQICSAWRP